MSGGDGWRSLRPEKRDAQRKLSSRSSASSSRRRSSGVGKLRTAATRQHAPAFPREDFFCLPSFPLKVLAVHQTGLALHDGTLTNALLSCNRACNRDVCDGASVFIQRCDCSSSFVSASAASSDTLFCSAASSAFTSAKSSFRSLKSEYHDRHQAPLGR